VATLAIEFIWIHKLLLFFDDLFYGKKPKIRDQPAAYEDYMMKEVDYWQMVESTSAEQALLTAKSISRTKSEKLKT